MGSGTPNCERSQHSVPSKQSFGSMVQPCTMQLWVMKESQNVASPSAQSAGVLQALPAPTGGRLQKEGEAAVSQAYPPVQSADAAQPELVQ
jgi:hypothetical protein